MVTPFIAKLWKYCVVVLFTTHYAKYCSLRTLYCRNCEIPLSRNFKLKYMFIFSVISFWKEEQENIVLIAFDFTIEQTFVEKVEEGRFCFDLEQLLAYPSFKHPRNDLWYLCWEADKLGLSNTVVLAYFRFLCFCVDVSWHHQKYS